MYVNYPCVDWAFVMRHPGTDVTEQVQKTLADIH